MENISRNFLYSNRKSVYTVTFMVQEGGEDLPFIMHTLSAKRTGIGFPSNNKKRISVHIPLRRRAVHPTPSPLPAVPSI